MGINFRGQVAVVQRLDNFIRWMRYEKGYWKIRTVVWSERGSEPHIPSKKLVKRSTPHPPHSRNLSINDFVLCR